MLQQQGYFEAEEKADFNDMEFLMEVHQLSTTRMNYARCEPPMLLLGDGN